MAERDQTGAGRQLVGRLRNRIGGPHSGSMTTAKAGINVDDQQLNKLRRTMQGLATDLGKVNKELGTALRNTNQLFGAMSGGGRGNPSGAAGTPAQPTFTNTSQVATPQTAQAGGGGRGSGMGGMGLGGLRGFANRFQNAGAGTQFLGAAIAGQVIGSGFNAMDQRFDRGIDYTLGVDRRSIVFQQMYNLQAQQVRQMRATPNNYLIGMGGANAMMDFQRQFGFNMMSSQMSRAIEGQRALSGFSKSTGDVLTGMGANLNPEIANRMFMMTGVSPLQMGGRGLTDPLKMQQQLASRFGLTNRNLITSSFAPGSVTFNNMKNAGLTEEMIQDTLQYASSNQTFRERGGKGNYDPGNAAHRRVMGIEGNLGTEAEKTDQARVRREERFMNSQYDAMVAVEKHTRDMVDILGRVETTLADAIGLRARTRTWSKPIGRALQVGGAITMAVTAPTGIGPAVGAGMMVAGTAISGDPVDATGSGPGAAGGTNQYSDSSRDASIMVPFGYGGGRKSLNDVKNSGTFKGMNPKMQQRMLAMMRANPNIGIGQGLRNSEEQRKMFLDRYRRTSKQTKIFWDGSYWEHVKGAAAAPPGKSMHEIGLAADLVGDIRWMNQNASRFGLRHFANVNNEPWHVQPNDVPGSRSEYEKGAPGGTADTMEGQTPQPVTGAPETAHNVLGIMNSAEFMNRGGMGMSLASIIGGGQGSRSRGGSLGMAMGFAGSRRDGQAGAQSPSQLLGSGATVPSAGALSGEQVAQLAYQAGFRGQALIDVVAIAKRESGWNPGAYNPNADTKDLSFGLMQINMLGSLEADRLKMFGISSKEALYDPLTNMKAAYKLYQAGGNSLHAWGGYKGKANTYNTDLAEAASIVKNAGFGGDPMLGVEMAAHAPQRNTSQGSVTIHSPRQITIAPHIVFQGVPQTPDLHAITQEVGRLLRKEVETMELRNA